MEIRIAQLTKYFGDKKALDIPSLEIHSGEIIGLVGNNGAGKTTLFRLMLDLLRRDGGTINYRFDGYEQDEDPAKSEDWKAHTGAYINDKFLIDFLTPEEYIDFIINTNNLPPIDWAHIEDSYISPYLTFAQGEVFGQKKYIRNLSAGNKQKLGVISVLLHNPQLVILDEPFNFLDPSGQNTLKQLLERYQQETHATVIVSSHNLQHTVDISSRVILLEKGEIVKDLDNNDRQSRSILEAYFEI